MPSVKLQPVPSPLPACEHHVVGVLHRSPNVLLGKNCFLHAVSGQTSVLLWDWWADYIFIRLRDTVNMASGHLSHKVDENSFQDVRTPTYSHQNHLSSN